MRRGDLITVALNGNYDKPRPALVIQSDALDETDSILVCLITTNLRSTPLYTASRYPADDTTGLQRPSQVMADKIMAVRRVRCGEPIGRVYAAALTTLGRQLAFMIGLGD